MKTNFFILLIAISMAFQVTVDAQNEKLITLPDIDISQSENGIVYLPANTPSLFTDIFSKYTKVTAPNGKPIHMLAQIKLRLLQLHSICRQLEIEIEAAGRGILSQQLRQSRLSHLAAAN